MSTTSATLRAHAASRASCAPTSSSWTGSCPAPPAAPRACRLGGGLPPAVALWDGFIPGPAGGAEACRSVREAHPDAPVVMLTGLNDAAARRDALAAGASAFLVKGLPLEVLVDELR